MDLPSHGADFQTLFGEAVLTKVDGEQVELPSGYLT